MLEKINNNEISKNSTNPSKNGLVNSTNSRNNQLKEVNNSKIIKGSIQDAVIRTFRGDITNKLGKDANNVVDSLIPKVSNHSQAPNNEHRQENHPIQKQNSAIVHTFKDDIQHVVRSEKMSITKIATLESDGNKKVPKEEIGTGPWKTTVKIVIILFFVVLGVVLLSGGYYIYKLNVSTNFITEFDPPILFTEIRLNIDSTDKSAQYIINTLENIRKTASYELGFVVDLYISEKGTKEIKGYKIPKRLSIYEVLSILEINILDNFKEVLLPDYMIGIYTTDDGNIPFMVLKTTSYSYAFAGMLEWEKNIINDLTPFFTPIPQIEETQGFYDTIIQNLDVRVLEDSNGSIILMYTIVNQSTIIITSDSRALIELANRVRTKR